MNEGPAILIIEDDPFLRFTLAAYLEDSGFTCLQASDGEAGLEAFAAHHPDLVVTDLRMPKLDGLEVVARLLREAPGLPVIVLSRASDETTAKQALALGARACLSKPVPDLGGFEKALRAMLQQEVPRMPRIDSVITCPECGFSKAEVMPTDACQWFYVCPNCHAKLRPKEGDCCVFCSYGSVPCPPVQLGGKAGKSCCGGR